MVDFNNYLGNYNQYSGRCYSYGGYDSLLKSVSDQNKGCLASKYTEKTNTSNPLNTGLKIGVAVAIGTGLALLIKGKGKQGLELIKNSCKNIKIPNFITNLFKKPPTAV